MAPVIAPQQERVLSLSIQPSMGSRGAEGSWASVPAVSGVAWTLSDAAGISFAAGVLVNFRPPWDQNPRGQP